MLTCGSLYTGFGGIDLGLLMSGLIDEIKWQVEINDYATKVLEKNFPDVKRHRNVRDVGEHNLKSVDLISAGEPCQPHSKCGLQKGESDDRYLWPETIRIIWEMYPPWVIIENVSNLKNMVFDRWAADLEDIGYKVISFDIPACAVGLPTMERHLWIIATSTGYGLERKFKEKLSNKCFFTKQLSGKYQRERKRWALPEARVHGVGERIPHRVERIIGLGNAVPPPMAQAIGELIKEFINGHENR